MKDENERMAIVETKLSGLEKAVEKMAQKFGKMIDRLDGILSQHENQMKGVIHEEMNIFQDRIKFLEKQNQEMEVLRFFSRHYKLAALVAAGLYLLGISDVRHLLFKLI